MFGAVCKSPVRKQPESEFSRRAHKGAPTCSTFDGDTKCDLCISREAVGTDDHSLTVHFDVYAAGGQSGLFHRMCCSSEGAELGWRALPILKAKVSPKAKNKCKRTVYNVED